MKGGKESSRERKREEERERERKKERKFHFSGMQDMQESNKGKKRKIIRFYLKLL